MKNMETVFFENGCWNFTAKSVDTAYFETTYSTKRGYASEEEARKDLDENRSAYRRDIDMIKKQTNIKFTFSEYLDYWYEKYCASSPYSPSYKYINAWTIYNIIKPGLMRDVLIGRVDNGYVEEILKSCRSYCPSAEEAVYKILHKAFADAQEDGYILTSPMRGLKTCARNIPKIEVMTKDQVRDFLREARKRPHIYLEVLLGLMCGLRNGEVRGLRYEDFDWEAKTLSVSRQRRSDTVVRIEKSRISSVNRCGHYCVPPKTASSIRKIQVPDFIFAALDERMAVNEQTLKKFPGNRADCEGFISISSHGLVSSGMTLTKNVKQIAADAGIRINMTFHTLRHTFCTILLECGIPLERISQILGHANIDTTFSVYCGVMEDNEEIKDAMSKLDPAGHNM